MEAAACAHGEEMHRGEKRIEEMHTQRSDIHYGGEGERCKKKAWGGENCVEGSGEGERHV